MKYFDDLSLYIEVNRCNVFPLRILVNYLLLESIRFYSIYYLTFMRLFITFT